MKDMDIYKNEFHKLLKPKDDGNEELEQKLIDTLKLDINNFLFNKVRGDKTINEFEDLAMKINDLIWDSFNN